MRLLIGINVCVDASWCSRHLSGYRGAASGNTPNLSRFKVARLLHLARIRGIVKISIATSSSVNDALSEKLATRLGLERCIVVNTTGGAQAAREQVAAAAARALPSLIKEGDLVGLSWSRTVESMVDMLTELPRCSVVQLAGSFSTTHGDALDLVHRAARLSGGSAYALHAPLVVDDPAVARALRRQPGIADTLQIADDVDVSVVAVGAWRSGCSTVWDAVTPTVQKAGIRAGAVGEVIGRLVGADGASIESPLDHLVVSASLNQLKRPAQRIALVSGPHRAVST
ncbi:MAG: hypothetical protein QOK15_2418, partial [Nocardioidaceae bacterium]|nr:hypothetical protein [Nocardioidaceae bacterium]